MWTANPFIYIDTNVVIDTIDKSNKNAIHLMETIRDKKWECATSTFTLLEVLDVKKDSRFIMNKLGEGYTIKWILRKRSEKDLSNSEMENIYEKMYNNFFDRYKFVEFYWLTMEGWERVIELGTKSNISAPDLIHLATALECNCDFLVTSDEFFCQQAGKFIRACTPDNFKEYFEGHHLKIS